MEDRISFKILQRDSAGDFRVVKKINGRIYEPVTYYTDDKEDAELTLKAMKNKYFEEMWSDDGAEYHRLNKSASRGWPS